MPRVLYQARKFRADALDIIQKANQVCSDYAGQGYDLTLRQLYYQFVSRGWIANRQSEYKRLGAVINDARLAGLLDWDYIVDRTRNLRTVGHWSSPASLIRAAANGYREDKWSGQPVRVEVWIEKDALVGVLEAVCPDEDVPYFSCRGYTSQSEIWGAAQRIGGYIQAGQRVVVLHLGDHDPSGIDMTRDIDDRLSMFLVQDYYNRNSDRFEGIGEVSRLNVLTDMRTLCGGTPFEVRRIALTMDQIEEHSPPPNPAKMTDARAQGYVDIYGDESWELDALPPDVLSDLIRDQVAILRDDERWAEAQDGEDERRALLDRVSRRWPEVRTFLTNGGQA